MVVVVVGAVVLGGGTLVVVDDIVVEVADSATVAWRSELPSAPVEQAARTRATANPSQPMRVRTIR